MKLGMLRSILPILSRRERIPRLFILLPVFLILLSCTLTAPAQEPWKPAQLSTAEVTPEKTIHPALAGLLPTQRPPGSPVLTPTPNIERVLPTLRSEEVTYQVKPNDTLNKISQQYGVSVQAIANASSLPDANLLSVGQELHIPPPQPGPTGTGFKIIPDSELVFGPASALLDTRAFVKSQGGYLDSYTEKVDEQTKTGAEIIERISREYSVNPRLLLSILEYQSGWVSNPNPDETTRAKPVAQLDSWPTGLYHQLSWAANYLNRGYYLWRVNAIGAWLLPDDSAVPVNPTINAGTAGVQMLFSQLYGRPEWNRAVSARGLFDTYQKWFGYPFDLAVENLIPPDLSQPELQLPFEPKTTWWFTGGPHGGWGDGSAWAAIDFAPPDGGHGCVLSRAWVVAVADGWVVRSQDGVVVLDLDGDGLEQTGWIILYLHIDTQDRVANGTQLKAGDRIGHPSCEGGVSNGTHVHLARRYNGEWIPADGSLPFVLDGWVSSGTGIEYDGFLKRQGVTVEAWDSRKDNNIQR